MATSFAGSSALSSLNPGAEPEAKPATKPQTELERVALVASEYLAAAIEDLWPRFRDIDRAVQTKLSRVLAAYRAERVLSLIHI